MSDEALKRAAWEQPRRMEVSPSTCPAPVLRAATGHSLGGGTRGSRGSLSPFQQHLVPSGDRLLSIHAPEGASSLSSGADMTSCVGAGVPSRDSSRSQAWLTALTGRDETSGRRRGPCSQPCILDHGAPGHPDLHQLRPTTKVSPGGIHLAPPLPLPLSPLFQRQEPC